MPTLTIFTPIYNRAYILPKLYKSLLQQTKKDFEWLIVDDGSTDESEHVVGQWVAENKIPIRYIQQTNGGKHRAINRGVFEAKGELFFIVDSDDYLSNDAVEWILNTANDIQTDDNFAGLSGIRIHDDGTKIGGGENFGTIDANAIDIRLKHNVVGDLAEVYKTRILKEFPFPEFEGEKFCPEALVWFRMARKYKMRFVHKGIYVCEYLGDGLTAKITQLRRKAPIASMTYYSEHFHDNIPVKWKLKAAINFWRFQLAPYNSKFQMTSPLALMGYFPGKLMSFIDNRK